MVKPICSKRKLFNSNRDYKENEPSVLTDCESGGFNSDLSVRFLQGQLHADISAHINSGLHFKSDNVATPLKPVNRPVMPMSERQQIALLMQMSSPSPPDKSEIIRATSPRTPNTPNSGRGVNKRNERGEMPLHVAAIKGDTEKVAQLISQGADVNAVDYAGKVAKFYIKGRVYTNLNVLKQSAKVINMDPEGLNGSYRGSLKFFEIKESKSQQSWTALHEACNRGFYKIARYLIRARANVNAKGLDNETPLHDACVNNHFKLVWLLLSCGASVDVVNQNNKKPRDVCRTPGILSLIEQATVGALPELDSSEEEFIENGMSKRTSPLCRVDEKTLMSSNYNQPVSPTRVTLRLNQGPKTPEKSQHEKSGGENTDDIYEFKCTKEESPEDKEEKESSEVKDLVVDDKSEKRLRESETVDEEEEGRKKKRKEETKENEKGPKCLISGSKQSNNGSNNGNSGSGSYSNDGKSPVGSETNSPKPLLSNNLENAECEEEFKGETPSNGAPKVPPLKIVIPTVAASEQEQSGSANGKNGTTRTLPYVVSAGPGDEKEMHLENKDTVPGGEDSSNSNCSNGNSNVSSPASSNSGVLQGCGLALPGEKGSGTRITRSQRGGRGSGEENIPVKTEIKIEEPAQHSLDVHPRKRKIKMKEPEPEPPVVTHVNQPTTNCYETFLKIRKQVERRRRQLFPVQPKPPEGFKDYLMNRCSYSLAGNVSEQRAIPTAQPSPNLHPMLKILFTDQEKERHKLKQHHIIEREKLVLSVEQEILRVHGRAARVLANQVYNVINSEQDEKLDRNARSRYNGRLFMAWLREVDDKWEKIKDNMVARQYQEADSLYAVQRMDWEWKMKELALCDANAQPQIDDSHIPKVKVSNLDLHS